MTIELSLKQYRKVMLTFVVGQQRLQTVLSSFLYFVYISRHISVRRMSLLSFHSKCIRCM